MDKPSPSGSASLEYSGKKWADLIWLIILAGTQIYSTYANQHI